MARVAKGTVELGVDTKGLVGAGSKIQSVMNVAKTGVLVGAAAMAAGFAAVTIGVKRSIDRLDELAKTAAKLGLGTQALAGLQLAADLTGVSTQNLNLGLQRMTRRVAEAAQGTGEASGALKELGIDAKHLASLTVDEQFLDIAEAMKNVKTQSDRVRLAFKLFDSGGVGLINTLKLGRKELEGIRRDAMRMGLAISEVDTKKIEDAKDAITLFGKQFEGFFNIITVSLAPAITKLATDMRAFMGDNIDSVDIIADSLVTTINLMRDLVGDADDLGFSFQGIAESVLTMTVALQKMPHLLNAMAVQLEINRRGVEDWAVGSKYIPSNIIGKKVAQGLFGSATGQDLSVEDLQQLQDDVLAAIAEKLAKLEALRAKRKADREKGKVPPIERDPRNLSSASELGGPRQLETLQQVLERQIVTSLGRKDPVQEALQTTNQKLDILIEETKKGNRDDVDYYEQPTIARVGI
jgi:hypothetical protein